MEYECPPKYTLNKDLNQASDVLFVLYKPCLRPIRLKSHQVLSHSKLKYSRFINFPCSKHQNALNKVALIFIWERVEDLWIILNFSTATSKLTPKHLKFF